jgi:hypothetical protein
MALAERGTVIRRLTQRLRGESLPPGGRRYRQTEERYESVSRAVDQWLSLLRDMEHAGQSGEARYETYYQAYLQARQQQKRIDLELFNLRQGLSSE